MGRYARRSALADGWISGPADAIGPADQVTYQQTIALDGTWSVTALPLEASGETGFREAARKSGNDFEVEVPGELHLDLMRAQRMESPEISDNARARCRWPEKYSWWYRKSFVLPDAFRIAWRQTLVFDGIDLYGQIFVNGTLAGETQNAFAPTQCDVKALLRVGLNQIVVRVSSGMELPAPPEFNELPYPWLSAMDSVYSAVRFQPNNQRRYLRKPAYATYGWDWCDPLPNIGIVHGVRLEGRSQVVLRDARLDTVIAGERVFIEGNITVENLHPWAEISTVLEVSVVSPQGAVIAQHLRIGCQPGELMVPCRLEVTDPRLWWPNGMGEQPLYQLTIRLICGNAECDRIDRTIGLRTIELERAALKEGSRFGFRVNGEQVFCKGGNWVPPDLIPARIPDTRYQALVAEAKHAHFNMLRVNGVGLYESDAFFDACDRAGILVWQDFTFSCAQYPDHDAAFLAQVRHEAETVVKRLRHHASLALWCGNNECTWFMQRDWNVQAQTMKHSCGARIYNEILPQICYQSDPARPYWPGSPSGGSDDPNGGLSGDTHWWGGGDCGDSLGHLTQAAVQNCRARFISEYGVMGPPSMASVEEYLKPAERSLKSVAWKIHTNMFENGGITRGIEHFYGTADDTPLKDFILYGQMYQAVLHTRVVEGMRFRKADSAAECQGVLVWSFNDAWGEVGWSIVDYYLRRKASYYAFRRSAMPVKVLVGSVHDLLVTRVVNDTRQTYQAEVRYGWMRLDGTDSEMQQRAITVPSNGRVEIARAARTPPGGSPEAWLYGATLTGDGLPPDQALFLFGPYRDLALAEPNIRINVGGGFLELNSPVYCHGVHLDDAQDGSLEDDYFDLLPGVPRRIAITAAPASGHYRLRAVLPRCRAAQIR